MTWEWSHTTEAYHYAEEQVHSQPREWLEVVWAEWIGRDKEDPNHLDTKRYYKALVRAKSKTDDQLADFIWTKMEQQRDCTNGGWEAHCCPFGCGCHMVPFSPEEEDED